MSLNTRKLSSPPPHRALLRVTGDDAFDFLQGQISNDMRRLNPVRATLSSLNGPKGRVLATLVVVPLDEGYGLLMAPDIMAAMHKRLQMFVLRSKVTLAPDSNAVAGVMDAEDGSQPWEIRQQGAILRIRAPGDVPRFWCIGQPEAAQEDSQAFARADIAAGLPCVGHAQSDAHVAQHIGLQRFGALSFDKGCFTGQEVIARLHYRGGIKRMPLRLVGSGAPPEPGVTLRNHEGSALAEVVNSVATDDGCEMLVVWRGLEAPEVVACDRGRFEVRPFDTQKDAVSTN